MLSFSAVGRSRLAARQGLGKMRFEILINQQHRQLNCYYSHHHHHPSTYGAERAPGSATTEQFQSPAEPPPQLEVFGPEAERICYGEENRLVALYERERGRCCAAGLLACGDPMGRCIAYFLEKRSSPRRVLPSIFHHFLIPFRSTLSRAPPPKRGWCSGDGTYFRLLSHRTALLGGGLRFRANSAAICNPWMGKHEFIPPNAFPNTRSSRESYFPKGQLFSSHSMAVMMERWLGDTRTDYNFIRLSSTGNGGS